tara:strand:+ start:512 stop:715 length:204 start_codon:yes stop_codon:yes gene_type:complete
MKEVFYELRESSHYKLIFLVVKNKMGTIVYRESLGRKKNWRQTDMTRGFLIDRDESYELLDAMRGLL